jgi:hypothetical protein
MIKAILMLGGLAAGVAGMALKDRLIEKAEPDEDLETALEKVEKLLAAGQERTEREREAAKRLEAALRKAKREAEAVKCSEEDAAEAGEEVGDEAEAVAEDSAEVKK